MNTLIILLAKYLYLVIILIAGIYFFRASIGRKKEIAWLGAIALPLSYLAAKISSLVYFDPRPFVVGHFTPLITHVADNGFPSDHTLISAAVASVVFAYNKTLGAVLIILALIVGVARVLAGVHHIVDVLGSIVIAAIVTTFVYHFIIPKIKQNQVIENQIL